MKFTRFKQIILTHLWQTKGRLVLAALCILGFTLAELLEPWPFKIIFDYVLLDKPLAAPFSFLGRLLQQGKELALLVISLTIIFIALAQGAFSYLQTYLTSRMGYEIVHTLRRELFAHLQRLSLAFHTRTRSGELLTKVTSDTNALKEFFAEWILTFTTEFLLLTGMCVVMFTLNWKLSLAVLATLPILFYSFVQLFWKIRAAAGRQRHQEGKIAARLSETLASVTLVQAFGREKYEEAAFNAESSQTHAESIRTARIEAIATRTVKIISAVGKWAVVLVGSWQVLKGQITPGDVLIYWAYVGKMYKPVQNLVKLSTRFTRVMVSIERINDILDLEPAIRDDPQAIPARHLKGGIVFDNVSFDYEDGKEVLHQASFAINPGQRVALVGASGAGKSTIVCLILRLFDPQEGSILIDGINIKRYQRESLRHAIGVVLQDSILFGTTVRENIAYGKPDATWEEIVAAAKAAHADEFITTLANGYDTLIGERGATLSGGQRQRLAIARALIRNTPILILDEPMTGLDVESEAKVQEAMQRLMAGKTCLVITHDLEVAAETDLVLVLEAGHIVECGDPAALAVGHGIYRQLYERKSRRVENRSAV